MPPTKSPTYNQLRNDKDQLTSEKKGLEDKVKELEEANAKLESEKKDMNFKCGVSEDTDDDGSFFETILKGIFGSDDDEKKDMKYDVRLRLYRQPKLNNKGTYIYDTELLVNNEVRPFASIDQVDNFLKNYIGRFENSKLYDSDPNKKDESLYFNFIEKSLNHNIARFDKDGNLLLKVDQANGDDKKGKDVVGGKSRKTKKGNKRVSKKKA
jgi:hypothetical protein